MSISPSSTSFTHPSASTAAGPITASGWNSHSSGKRHVLLTSFVTEGALPSHQSVPRNSQFEEEWTVNGPCTYMLPCIIPADEPNEQTDNSTNAALEFVQKWAEASDPSKNYDESLKLDKTLDWPEPTASFLDLQKFTGDYVSNVQQELCRRVADRVAKSMENNDFFTYSVVDWPEFTSKGGLIPPGRIKPMDLEEYISRFMTAAEDQQAWKEAQSMSEGSSIVFFTSCVRNPNGVYVRPDGEWDTHDPGYRIQRCTINNPHNPTEEMAKGIDIAIREIDKRYLSPNWDMDLPSVRNNGISLVSDVEHFKNLNKLFAKALQSRSQGIASEVNYTLKSSGVTGVSTKWVSPLTFQSMFLQNNPPPIRTSRGEELLDYEQLLHQDLLRARHYASVSQQTEDTSSRRAP